jgi:hypothetical protein
MEVALEIETPRSAENQGRRPAAENTSCASLTSDTSLGTGNAAKRAGRCGSGGMESEPSSDKDQDAAEQAQVTATVPTRLSSEQVLQPGTFALETTKVRFLCVNGDAFSVSFPVYATIGQVKEALLALQPKELLEQLRVLHQPPCSTASDLRILYLGNVLEDTDTLLECGFQVGLCQTVHVVTRPATESGSRSQPPSSPQHPLGSNFVSYLWSSHNTSRNRVPGSEAAGAEAERRHRRSHRQVASRQAGRASTSGTRSTRSQRSAHVAETNAPNTAAVNGRVGCSTCTIT